MMVRPATPADVADVTELLSARDHQPRDPRIISGYLWGLDSNHARAWLAYAGQRPVGITMLYLRRMNWPQAGHSESATGIVSAGYWAHLYVEPAFRKQMIYPQLVLAMIRGMPAAGISVIFTATRQPHVAEGHQKLGFALVGKIPVQLRPLRAFRLLAKHKGYARLGTLCLPLDTLYRFVTRRRMSRDVEIESIGLESPKVEQIVEVLNNRPQIAVRQIWTCNQFRRRYRTTLDGTSYRITAVSRDNRIKAALIMAIAERGNHIRAAVLLELIAHPGATAGEVSSLLADAEAFAHQQGAEIVLGMSDSVSVEQLQNSGGKYLTSGSEIYHLLVYPKAMAQPPYLAAELASWKFAFADHDAF